MLTTIAITAISAIVVPLFGRWAYQRGQIAAKREHIDHLREIMPRIEEMVGDIRVLQAMRERDEWYRAPDDEDSEDEAELKLN